MDGGREGNPAAPQSPLLTMATEALAAGGLGKMPGKLPDGSPWSLRGWGCRGDAVPPRPSRPQAWQGMKAQLCSSRAAARPCLGSGPGWDSSPRHRRQMPRREVPPNSAVRWQGLGTPRTPPALDARPPSCCSSILLPHGAFVPPGRPKTLRHRGAWAGGWLPSPARGWPCHRDDNRLIERWLEKSLRTMRALRTRASSQRETTGGCVVVTGAPQGASSHPGGIQPWKACSILTPSRPRRGSGSSEPWRLQAGR